MLLRALAKTGIVALIGEVAGYELDRKTHSKLVLEIIVGLAEETGLAWAKKFPD